MCPDVTHVLLVWFGPQEDFHTSLRSYRWLQPPEQSSAVPVEQVKGPMILGSDGCAGSSPYADFEGAEQNHVRVVAGKRLRSFWVLVELLL